MSSVQEYMPKGGIKELVKSAEGRRYLARLQKKYEIDIIQPSDPRFEKIYGHKRRQFLALKEKQEKQAEADWAELQEKKAYIQKHGGKL